MYYVCLYFIFFTLVFGCVCASMCFNLSVCWSIHVCLCMFVCVYLCVLTYPCVFMCVCMCLCVYMRKCVYVYVCPEFLYPLICVSMDCQVVWVSLLFFIIILLLVNHIYVYYVCVHVCPCLLNSSICVYNSVSLYFLLYFITIHIIITHL
jgi:hypothetical protein